MEKLFRVPGNIFYRLCGGLLLALFMFSAAFCGLAHSEGQPAESQEAASLADGKPVESQETASPAARGVETGSAGADQGMAGSEAFSSASGENLDMLEQAAYPGVVNRVLESETDSPAAIKLYYPEFGNKMVDAEIRTWIKARRQYYESLLPEKGGEGDEDGDNPGNWEMTGFYTLEYPRGDVVSALFNIYAYTGGAHGNLWLYSLNYNLKSGKQLHLGDLFEDSALALETLSRVCIAQLARSIGEDTDEEWLERGAGPEEENFTVLTLMPNGLYVEFQPYQVGPWAIGPQRVFVALEDLMAARPSPEVWKLPAATEVEQRDNPTANEKESDSKEE